MTTPTRRRTLRSRLLARITDATSRLTGAWGILIKAQKTLLAALARIRPGRTAAAKIRNAAQEFQRRIADFDRAMAAFAARWAATDLPLAYREGALTMLDHADRPYSIWSWTGRHQAAITSLTAQFYADLMGRLGEAVRRARQFLRAAQDAARSTDRFNGASLLRDHPLDTVIYANQARHPVESWARAAISWQTVTTANVGAARTALDELNCRVLEVRDGPECGWASHQDSDLANGTLRTVEDALAHPTAHSNCIREFLPRPDLNRNAAALGGP